MEWLRVIEITLMVASLFALAATGVMMLVTVRRKKRAPGAKGWHRPKGPWEAALTIMALLRKSPITTALPKAYLTRPRARPKRMPKSAKRALPAQFPTKTSYGAGGSHSAIALVAAASSGIGCQLFRVKRLGTDIPPTSQIKHLVYDRYWGERT